MLTRFTVHPRLRILVDTSALLRYIDPDDKAHESVVEAVNDLVVSGCEVGFTPQVLREVWNVATRPSTANGFGLEPAVVAELVTDLQNTFELWDDVPGIAAQWQRLAIALNVRGVQVHDANLAAAALRHGASKVLTLDRKDFDRYRRFGLEPTFPGDS